MSENGRCDRKMSLEAINRIRRTEEEVRQRRNAALQEAKAKIAEEEAAGKARIEAAHQKAAEELADKNERADDLAREEARKLAESTENRKAGLRAKAETRLDEAAGLIVERIVKF